MQVSWIDPEEIARLAAQLEGPLVRGEMTPLDLDTLPDAPPEPIPDISDNTPPPASSLADAPPTPEDEPERAALAIEAARIRERLRAIRARADDAGMLSRDKASAAPETAPAGPVDSPASDPRISGESPATDAEPEPVPAAIAPEPAAQQASRIPIRIPPPPAARPAPTVPPRDAPSPEGPLTERLRSFMPWAHELAGCEDILLVDDHGDLLWGAPSHTDLALSATLAAEAGLRTGGEAAARSSVFIRSRQGHLKELCVIPCATRLGTVILALVNGTGLTQDTAAFLRESLIRCVEGNRHPAHPAAEA